MVDNSFIQCDSCESIIRVRTQMEVMEGFPINIHCGNCERLIEGELTIKENYSSPKMELSGAKRLDSKDGTFEEVLEKTEYDQEISPTFPVKIMRKKVDEEDYDGTPYMRSVQLLGLDGELINDWKNAINKARYHFDEEWNDIKAINDHWINQKFLLLKNELGMRLPEEKFPLSNKLEYLRGVHILNVNWLINLIGGDRFSDVTQKIFRNLSEIMKNNTSELSRLEDYLNENDLLKYFQERIFGEYDNFSEKFDHFIPITLLKITNTDPENLKEDTGISTTTFDKVRNIYKDLFEVVMDLSCLVAFLNNIIERGAFDEFESNNMNPEKYGKLSMGNKFDHLDLDEGFSFIFEIEPDNKIRNSIGHNQSLYNPLMQRIDFQDKDGHSWETYSTQRLICFMSDVWDLLITLGYLDELLYQLRKVEFAKKGIGPEFDPEAFDIDFTQDFSDIVD